jgi:hypothetical protein
MLWRAARFDPIDDRPSKSRPDLLQLVDGRDDLPAAVVIELVKQPSLDLLGQLYAPPHPQNIS